MKTPPRAAAADSGTILVLGLLMLLIATMLAIALLSVTKNEAEAASRFDDHNKALTAAEAGVQEVLWRLRMRDDNKAPPTAGSMVTGYGIPDFVVDAPDRYRLRANGAYINSDPFELSGALVGIPSVVAEAGDGLDSDGDGLIDEIDELDLWRDWRVRIVYGYYDATKQTFDNDKLNASLRGDDLVLPSVILHNQLNTPTALDNGAGRLEYTSADENDADVLVVRFLREDPDFQDYCKAKGCLGLDGAADIDADGVNDLVYWEELLPSNGEDDKNTISGRDDSTTDNESPYNIDFKNPAAIVGPAASFDASGYPVIVVESVGRVIKGKRVVARRRLQARLSYRPRFLVSAAVCTCLDVVVSGSIQFHSFDSKNSDCMYPNVPYDSACPLDDEFKADVATNGTMTFQAGTNNEIYGSVRAFADIDGNGGPEVHGGVAESSGGIDCSAVEFLDPADSTDRCLAYDPDMEPPCACIDIEAEVMARQDPNNDNAGIVWYDTSTAAGSVCDGSTAVVPTDPENPSYSDGFLYLPQDNEYYFESFDLSDAARVLTGPIDSQCQITTRAQRPIRIYVEDSMFWPNPGSYFTFDRLAPAEYLVFYWGAGAPQTFAFRGGGKYFIHLLAPEATITFQGNPDIVGSIVAFDSDSQGLSGNTRFFYDVNVEDSFRGTRRPSIIAWRELP